MLVARLAVTSRRKKHMQSATKPRVWLTSTLLLLVALLAACGGPGTKGNTSGTHTKAAASQQVYASGQLYGISDFGSLDPHLTASLEDAFVVDSIFVGMVQLNAQGAVYCELCSSYSVAPDHVTWTFTLKPNLMFSDGTPLTSADVVYSINRALDPATQSGTGPYYLRYIKDASAFAGGSKTIKTLIGDSLLAPDPTTVKIIAASPVAFFLDSLTYPTSYVVEKSVVQKWGKSWTDHLSDNGGQGGAGPWKMKSYVHGKQAVLVPNPNYWGPKPQLREAIYPFFRVADTTYNAYLVNQLDDTTIPVPEIDKARTRSDFYQVPQLWINYYSMNYSIKPFDVVACRQAFALAVNKKLIAQSVRKNTVIPTNHIVPQGMPGYDPNLKGPDGTTSTSGNPTQAKADLQSCLTQEGYSSASQMPPITLTFASGGQQVLRNEAAVLQQEWQSTLGISVKLEDIDLNKLITYITAGCSSNPLQFWGIAWIADYPDPQDWLTLQFDKDQANNAMCYGQNKGPSAAEQQQVQKALEAADVNSNPAARMAAYNQAEQSLVNDVAWLPISQQTVDWLRKPCLQNWTATSYGLMPPQDWTKIYISTDTPCATATVTS
jgi:oligopeptide transport system substrate-binding protein